MGTARSVLLAAALVGTGCGGASRHRLDDSPEGGRSGEFGGAGAGGTVGGTAGGGVVGGAGAGTAGSPGAIPVECRSPEETGCATCCVHGEGDGAYCRRLSSTGGGRYDTAREEADCAADCPKCADCPDPRIDFEPTSSFCQALCDCTTVDIGGDPCITPESCACKCILLRDFERSCPILDLCP